jgi:histone deacetylase complex subunit SAP18
MYSTSEFAAGLDLPDHVEIYTWSDASLQELAQHLIKQLPGLFSDPAGMRLAFRLVFPDTRAAAGPPRYMTKELGSVVIGDDGLGQNGVIGGEADKTLGDARFVIGDYISCAYYSAAEASRAHSPPRGPVREPGGFGGGRGYAREPMGPRDDFGFGGRGGRGGRGGGFGRGMMGAAVPAGAWSRGERVPEGPRGRRGGGQGFADRPAGDRRW